MRLLVAAAPGLVANAVAVESVAVSNTRAAGSASLQQNPTATTSYNPRGQSVHLQRRGRAGPMTMTPVKDHLVLVLVLGLISHSPARLPTSSSIDYYSIISAPKLPRTTKPTKRRLPKIPTIQQTAWAINPIDGFSSDRRDPSWSFIFRSNSARLDTRRLRSVTNPAPIAGDVLVVQASMPTNINNCTNVALAMALHVWPFTATSRTFIATNSVVVPCRS
jgi:hypothetical protein